MKKIEDLPKEIVERGFLTTEDLREVYEIGIAAAKRWMRRYKTSRKAGGWWFVSLEEALRRPPRKRWSEASLKKKKEEVNVGTRKFVRNVDERPSITKEELVEISRTTGGYITTSDLQKYLGITRQGVNWRIRAGKLRAIWWGGRYLVSLEEALNQPTKISPNKIAPEDIPAILALRAEGLSTKDIAQRYHVTPETVRRTLRGIVKKAKV